ncbi:H/ACA ribonucleoprotein complex subunit Gar1/Naf1 [Trinorchestia longiramus]|nr:H/ACA ribonucleoprotein complex subunit Gar1/Naf1 [Trinorchestia longiramus]
MIAFESSQTLLPLFKKLPSPSSPPPPPSLPSFSSRPVYSSSDGWCVCVFSHPVMAGVCVCVSHPVMAGVCVCVQSSSDGCVVNTTAAGVSVVNTTAAGVSVVITTAAGVSVVNTTAAGVSVVITTAACVSINTTADSSRVAGLASSSGGGEEGDGGSNNGGSNSSSPNWWGYFETLWPPFPPHYNSYPTPPYHHFPSPHSSYYPHHYSHSSPSSPYLWPHNYYNSTNPHHYSSLCSASGVQYPQGGYFSFSSRFPSQLFPCNSPNSCNTCHPQTPAHLPLNSPSSVYSSTPSPLHPFTSPRSPCCFQSPLSQPHTPQPPPPPPTPYMGSMAPHVSPAPGEYPQLPQVNLNMNSSQTNPVSKDEVEFTELIISDIQETKLNSAAVKDEKVSAIQQSSIQASSTTSQFNNENNSSNMLLSVNNENVSVTSNDASIGDSVGKVKDRIVNSAEQVTKPDENSESAIPGVCDKNTNCNDGASPIIIKVSMRAKLPNSITRSTASENGSKLPSIGCDDSECPPADTKRSDIIADSQLKQMASPAREQLLPKTEIVENMTTNENEDDTSYYMETIDGVAESCSVDSTVVNENTDPEVTVLENESPQKQLYREQPLVYNSNDEWSSDSEADSTASEKEDSAESSSDESSTSSSEEEKDGEEEEATERVKKTSQIVRKKKDPKGAKLPNELTLDDLTKIEDLQISVPEEEAQSIGVVSSIVNQLVVVQSHPNLRAIDLGSILFLKQGSEALGEIYDVMGCVDRPYYVVRFNSRLHITERGIAIGQEVFSAPRTSHCTFVDVESLMRQTGSDASWEHDREPPANAVEYSDDEEEQRNRRAKKNRNRNEEGCTVMFENHQKRTRSDNYFARTSVAHGGCPPVSFTGQPPVDGRQVHCRPSFGNRAFNGTNHYNNNRGFGNSNFNRMANGNPSFRSNFCPPPMSRGQFGPPSFTAPPSAFPPRSMCPPPPPSPIFRAPPPSFNFTTPSQSPQPWVPSSNSQHNMSLPPPPPGEPRPPMPFSLSTPPPSAQYFGAHQRFSSVFGQPPPPPPAVQCAPAGLSWDGGSGNDPRENGSATSNYSNPWAVPPPSVQNSYSNSSPSNSQYVPQFPSVPFNAMNPPPQPPTGPY